MVKDSAKRLNDPSRVLSEELDNSSGRDNFSHINTLARLPGKTRGLPSVISKFQVIKHKFTLQKQNKLSKANTNRMNKKKKTKIDIWELNIKKLYE